MTTITVGPKGQITIPMSFRKALDLKSGSKVIIDVIDWKNQKAIVIFPKLIKPLKQIQ